MNLKKRLHTQAARLKMYWKTPPEGRYMSFKEICSLSIGGMGVNFIVYCTHHMILSVGNTLIGNTIGIPPSSMYAIYLISVLTSVPLTSLRANLIDNSRSKKGKYRPFILSMGLPTAILAIAFAWMPYERMNDLGKCITVLLFNIGFQFFYNFMSDSYKNIIHLLSPNTIERSDVCSIKSVTDSFAPTVIAVLQPLLARLITGENTLYDLRLYRYAYPPIIIGGFLLSMLVYFNTEEKTIQAKTHSVNIRFTDAVRAVSKNKYFWICAVAGWVGFLEGSFDNIMGWLYNYQEACSATEYSLISAIKGNASLWPMLLAPFLIRAIGKRNMLISSNLLNIVFILLMYPIISYSDPQDIIWLLLVCFFMNSMATMLSEILTPSIQGDIRDYHHYITGERLDGAFILGSLIGEVIRVVTNSILPMIYENAGLNKTVALSLGYDGSNVYDVLYNTSYFKSISKVLVIASSIGALFNVIPFFFYDLTEIKQKAMVAVLKIRVLFEDYGNNKLSSADLTQALEIIDNANKNIDKLPKKLSKASIRTAKKSKNKLSIKAAKAAYKEDKLTNENIEIAKYVIREITKFDRPEIKADLELANKIFNAGLSGFAAVSTPSLKEAKALPKSTAEEREYRNEAIGKVKSAILSKKTIAKYYPNGFVEFDAGVFDKLFSEEDRVGEELKSARTAVAKAKKDKKTDEIKKLRLEISELNITKRQIRLEIKKATSQNSIYSRAVKPYLDAKRLITQQENYSRYEDIMLIST